MISSSCQMTAVSLFLSRIDLTPGFVHWGWLLRPAADLHGLKHTCQLSFELITGHIDSVCEITFFWILIGCFKHSNVPPTYSHDVQVVFFFGEREGDKTSQSAAYVWRLSYNRMSHKNISILMKNENIFHM